VARFGVVRDRLTLGGDIALAVVTVGITQLAVWTGTVRGPHLPNALLLLAVTAPVAVKSRWPLRTAIWSSLLLSVQVALLGASETAGLMLTFLALSYTLASRCVGGLRVLGLTALLVAGLWHEARDPDIHSFVDALFTPIVVAVAATLGYAVQQVRTRAELAERQLRMADEVRAQAEQLAAGQERERIARELHDVLAHTVSVMVVQAEAAEELLDTAPDRARTPVVAVQRVGREAMTELRTMLHGLRRGDEPARGPRPDLDDLERLVHEGRDAGQDIVLRIDGEPRPLPATTSASVYRVVQEALTNSRKHALGSGVDVHLSWLPRDLVVTVSDTGGGARQSSPPGHGLIGMRERVEVVGGQLQIVQDGGFRIRAAFPVAEAT
jgi:signal transduction histidine kinase